MKCYPCAGIRQARVPVPSKGTDLFPTNVQMHTRTSLLREMSGVEIGGGHDVFHGGLQLLPPMTCTLVSP